MPAALLVASVLCVATQPAGRFESADGKFRVIFPGKPTEEKKPIRPGGEALVHITKFEDAAGGRLVLWSAITAKDATPGKVLDGAAKGVGQQGKLVSDKEATVGPDKLAARDVTVDSPSGPRVRTLLVVADGRLYQVIVSGSNEFVTSPLADDFRKSFELDPSPKR